MITRAFTALACCLAAFICTPLLGATITVTTDVDEPLGTDNGNCTLREAVEAANDDAARDGCAAGSGADDIMFAGDYLITLSQGVLNINTEMTINDEESGVPRAIVLDGDGSGRIFRINGTGTPLTIANMTIQNGASAAGGAIMVGNNAQFFASFVTFFNNSGTSDGGAISSNGDLTLTGVIFINNSSDGRGGAISHSGDNLIISGGFFGLAPLTGNTAAESGGAIHINTSGSSDYVLIDGAFFNFNRADATESSAERGGGAIWADTSSSDQYFFQLDNAIFLGNSTDGSGGALLATNASRIAYADPLVPFAGGIVRTHFEMNTAELAGGAIHNRGTMTVTASSFARNTATSQAGGAISHQPGSDRPLTIANVTMVENSAGTDGGAVSSISATTGTISILNSTIVDNTAMATGGTDGGGGIYNNNSSADEFTVANTVIASNISGGVGGNCAGDPIQDDGNNLQFGASDCTGFATGDPLLDTAMPDPASPNPLVFVMQPLDGSAVHGAGNNSVCNAGPVFFLDGRMLPRPMGAGNCDIGAYESDGQYLPPDDVIFVDNYAPPSCSDSDSNGPDVEAGALNLGNTSCSGSADTLTADGFLGTLDDVDHFRYTVGQEGGGGIFCGRVNRVVTATPREVRTCAFYSCLTGPTVPRAQVRCRTNAATLPEESALGYPGCCSTEGVVQADFPSGSPCENSGFEDRFAVIIRVDQPSDACTSYSVEAAR